MFDPARELAWLRKVRDLSHRLAEEPDAAKLIPMILDAAIEITGAERGFLVRRRALEPGGKPKINLEIARGFDKETLSGPKGNVSRTVVQRVLDRKAGLVTTEEEDKDVLAVTSVYERRVKSILCVPLLLRGEARGVLYLDHRFERDSFTTQDLEVLGTFAAQAALALETLEERAQREEDLSELSAQRLELEALRERERAREQAVAQPAERVRFGGLVGGSLAMRAVYAEIERMARSDAPVLVLGEGGSGKELVARELHARGPNASEPWLAFNCGSVNEQLADRDLFGADSPGLLAQAGAGTLFLDSVADLSVGTQGKLLRVLQEGELASPEGVATPIRCRLVAASAADLSERLANGAFREDLYYRLDVLRIEIPPLRERGDDVLSLFKHLGARHGRTLTPTSEAAALLRGYAWPGNARQLENEVRRLAALEVDLVGAEHLSREIRAARPAAPARAAQTLQDVERETLEAALRECNGNKTKAAKRLGIPRSTLYYLLDRHKRGKA